MDSFLLEIGKAVIEVEQCVFDWVVIKAVYCEITTFGIRFHRAECIVAIVVL